MSKGRIFLLHQENAESIFLFFYCRVLGLALWRSMAWRTIIAGLYYVLHFKVYLFHLFVVCFQGKEKAERSRASGTAPSRPTTRMEQKRADRRRETLQQSAQKHREKQSLQKKRQVNEKRMAYYYRVKAERKAVHQGNMGEVCSS